MSDNVIHLKFDDQPPGAPTHQLQLAVSVRTPQEWNDIHERFSLLAARWKELPYVSVISTDLTVGSIESHDERDETLTHTEDTLHKVQQALVRGLSQEIWMQSGEESRSILATNLITEMQNAGIIFRERV